MHEYDGTGNIISTHHKEEKLEEEQDIAQDRPTLVLLSSGAELERESSTDAIAEDNDDAVDNNDTIASASESSQPPSERASPDGSQASPTEVAQVQPIASLIVSSVSVSMRFSNCCISFAG